MKSASLLYSKIDDFINEISKFWVHIMFLENTQCVWVQKISCGPQFRYFVLFGVSSYWLLLPLKNYWKHFSTKYFYFIENIFIFSHGFPSHNSFQIMHNSPPTQFQTFSFSLSSKNYQANKHTGRIKIKEIKHKLTSSYERKMLSFLQWSLAVYCFLPKGKISSNFTNRCLG